MKQEKSVNLYRTHTLLLTSTLTLYSPLTHNPPVFCVRASTGGGKERPHLPVSITLRIGHRERPTLQEAL